MDCTTYQTVVQVKEAAVPQVFNANPQLWHKNLGGRGFYSCLLPFTSSICTLTPPFTYLAYESKSGAPFCLLMGLARGSLGGPFPFEKGWEEEEYILGLNSAKGEQFT